MIEARFEKAFLEAVKKHSSIKKQIEKKVQMILENPISLGEPLKGNFRGFYSCPVKKSYLIVYLYCDLCRKKGDSEVVACSDCSETPDATIKFVMFAPHDDAYGI